MKFVNFLRNHIVIPFAALALVIAGIVAGSAFGKSKGEYNAYLKEYEATQEKLKGDVPQLPKSIVIDNGYVSYGNSGITSSKSAYTNKAVYYASDAKVAPLNDAKSAIINKIDAESDDPLDEYITALDRSGGAITFKIVAEETGLADVAIEMASHWLNDQKEIIEIANLSDQIKIQFNKLEVKTEDICLPALTEQAEEFTTVVLKDVLLLKGTNSLTFTTSAYNPYKVDDANAILYVMPDIRNVAVMSSVELIAPER